MLVQSSSREEAVKPVHHRQGQQQRLVLGVASALSSSCITSSVDGSCPRGSPTGNRRASPAPASRRRRWLAAPAPFLPAHRQQCSSASSLLCGHTTSHDFSSSECPHFPHSRKSGLWHFNHICHSLGDFRQFAGRRDDEFVLVVDSARGACDRLKRVCTEFAKR